MYGYVCERERRCMYIYLCKRFLCQYMSSYMLALYTLTILLFSVIFCKYCPRPRIALQWPEHHLFLCVADCEDVYLQGGIKYPGVYYILIQPSPAPEPFKVGCQVTDDAGIVVMLRSISLSFLSFSLFISFF